MTSNHLIFFITSIICFALYILACQDSPPEAMNDETGPFTYHGIAADIAAESPGNPTIVIQNEKGEPLLAAWIASIRASFGVLVINLATGEYEQVHMPWDEPRDQARTTMLGSNNRVYTLVQDHFLELDPIKREWTAVKEAAGPSLDGVLGHSLRESPDGVIWAATHHEIVHLNAFDMETGELTWYENVNEEDWLQYPNMIAFDDQGWVYLAIGPTIPRLVAFNPETEQSHRLLEGDAERAGDGTPTLRQAVDGQVYAHVPGGDWHRLVNGQPEPIEASEPPEEIENVQYRGEMPDGWTLQTLSMPGRYVRAIDPDRQTVEIEFEYEAAGARIHALAAGPDGRIHGTTGHPGSIWAYDPQADRFEVHNPVGGRWGSITSYEDRIFAGTYPRGALIEFDPFKEWTYRADHEMNPRFIMESRDVVLGDTRSRSPLWRARAIAASPSKGYVLLGGNAFTGHTGSGLVLYNVNTGEYKVLEDKDAVEHQSTLALTTLEDGTFLGGTTVSPVIGGLQRAEEAVLYILDPEVGRIIWQEAVTPGIDTIRDMILGPDGLVYGIYGLEGGSVGTLNKDTHLFVFDPETREIIYEEDVQPLYGRATGDQDPRTLIVGPDDNIYGLFTDAIVRIYPETFKHEKVGDPPVTPRTGIGAVGGRIYFADRSELWSFAIPGLN